MLLIENWRQGASEPKAVKWTNQPIAIPNTSQWYSSQKIKENIYILIDSVFSLLENMFCVKNSCPRQTDRLSFPWLPSCPLPTDQHGHWPTLIAQSSSQKRKLTKDNRSLITQFDHNDKLSLITHCSKLIQVNQHQQWPRLENDKFVGFETRRWNSEYKNHGKDVAPWCYKWMDGWDGVWSIEDL